MKPSLFAALSLIPVAAWQNVVETEDPPLDDVVDPETFPEPEEPLERLRKAAYPDDFLQKIEITVADTFMPEYVPVEPRQYGARKKRTSWK